MRDLLPHDHHSFASALPEMREHFENAAKSGGDYSFIFRSIAEDLRNVEAQVLQNGVAGSRQAIDTARHSMILVYEEPDFGAVGGELAAAAAIAQRHHNKRGNPGL